MSSMSSCIVPLEELSIIQPTNNFHCAYCHQYLVASEVKRCGKCKTRPYCGKECQALDWKPKKVSGPTSSFGLGQGHKDWCGLQVLVEDVHFELVPVEGKGLGLVAKTLIPKLSRIAVEGPKERGSRFVPEFEVYRVSPIFGEGARTKFANHCCDANAHRMEDPVYQVHILFSKREIAPGEEICVNYTGVNECHFAIPGTTIETTAESREELKTMFGIVCPSVCFCRSEGLDNVVTDFKRAVEIIQRPAIGKGVLEGDTKEECLATQEYHMAMVEAALKGNDDVRGNPITRARLLNHAFQVACRSSRTLGKALEYIQEGLDIWNAIVHPKAVSTKEGAVGYHRDPSSFKGYLCLDKKWGKLT